MPKVLTDRQLKGAKPGQKQYELADGKQRGLSLRILPSGAKRWAFRYRKGRRWRRVVLGGYPNISLKDARELADEKLRQVTKEGRDPSRERREQLEQPTFWGLAEQYLDQWALGPGVGPRQARKKATNAIPEGSLLDGEGKRADIWTYEVREGTPRKRSWKDDRRRLLNDIPKRWRDRSPEEITVDDVEALIDSKVAEAPVSANRLRALLHKLFQHAVKRRVVTSNPVAATEKPAEEKERDRVLSQDEVRSFWEATEDMQPASMRAFWRLRLVTAQRAIEVGSMRWEDLDLENGWWTIPAERSKNKKSHRVPLSAMALEILAELPKIKGYVLAGSRGKRQQGDAAKTIPIVNFRGHDLRRTAASMMASIGVPRFVIGRILNHAESGVTATYDRHSYDPEKRQALDTWGRKLQAILGHVEGAEVVPFTKSR